MIINTIFGKTMEKVKTFFAILHLSYILIRNRKYPCCKAKFLTNNLYRIINNALESKFVKQ